MASIPFETASNIVKSIGSISYVPLEIAFSITRSSLEVSLFSSDPLLSWISDIFLLEEIPPIKFLKHQVYNVSQCMYPYLWRYSWIYIWDACTSTSVTLLLATIQEMKRILSRPQF